ncbi:MAG: hypothetical protein ACE5I7_18955 [Candidatus Binatia bacterium]
MRWEDTTAPLPGDLERAHRLIAARFSDLDHSSRREGTLREQSDESSTRERILHEQVSEERRRVEALEQQLHWLRKYVFGRRSEKGVPVEQQALAFTSAAGQVEHSASDEDGGEQCVLTEVPAHTRRKRGGRRPLPTDLPREIGELRPAAADRCCLSCKTDKVRIGADRTEELDYVPRPRSWSGSTSDRSTRAARARMAWYRPSFRPVRSRRAGRGRDCWPTW